MRSDRVLSTALGLCLAGLVALWLLSRLSGDRPAVPGPPGARPALAAEPRSPAPDAGVQRSAPGPAPEPPGPTAAPPAREPAPARDAAAPEPEPDDPARTAALSGRLVDRRGGPLAGALVLAAPREPAGPWPLDQGAETTRSERTDAAGAFLITGLPPGHTRLAARTAGHAPLELDDLWLPLDTIDVGALVLADGRRLEGKVLDERDRGVEGALLALLPPSLPWEPERLNASAGIPLGSTGPNGRFALDQLPAGGWHLVVSHPLHAQLVFAGDETLEDPRIRLGAALVSRVVPRDGWPAVAAVVQAQPAAVALDPSWSPPASRAAGFRSAWIDPEGTLLHGLEIETPYEFRLQPASFAADAGLVPQRGPIALPDRQVPADGGLGALLEGTAVARDGRPLLEPALQLVGAAPRAPELRRGLDGAFVTEPVFGLAAGPAPLLLAGAPGYAPRWFELELAHGTTLDLGRWELEPLPTFELRVTGEDGAPLEAVVRSAALALLPAPGSPGAGPWYAPRRESFAPPLDPTLDTARTDPRGLARIRAPTAGATLRVEAPDHGPLEQRADELLDTWSPTADVRLAAPGRVEVRVLAAPGAPPCVEVLRAAPGPTPWGLERHGAWVVERAFPDAEGRAVFEGLGAGRSLFAALPVPVVGPEDAGELDWVRADVLPGESTHVTLAPRAFSHLEGRLALNGAALPGAELALEWGPGGFELAGGAPRGLPARTRTDERGRFRVPNLLRGAVHSLTVRLPDGRITRRDVLVDGEPFELELGDTRLLGAVTGPGGEPIEGLEVVLRCSVAGTALEWAALVSELLPPVPVLDRAWTDGAGWFELGSFPPGVTCELVLGGADGLEVVPLALGPGERRPLELRRSATARVELRTRSLGWTTGSGVLALIAVPADEGSRRPRVRTMEWRRWTRGTVEELPAGTWTLRLALLEAGVRIVQLGPALVLELEPGEHRQIELDWPPR